MNERVYFDDEDVLGMWHNNVMLCDSGRFYSVGHYLLYRYLLYERKFNLADSIKGMSALTDFKEILHTVVRSDRGTHIYDIVLECVRKYVDNSPAFLARLYSFDEKTKFYYCGDDVLYTIGVKVSDTTCLQPHDIGGCNIFGRACSIVRDKLDVESNDVAV